jgi:hypothetical protein
MTQTSPSDVKDYDTYLLDCDPCLLCKYEAHRALLNRGYIDVIIDVVNKLIYIHKDYKFSTIAGIIKANSCIIVTGTRVSSRH